MNSADVTALKAHVAINVRNVEASLEFYRKLFGIEPCKVRKGYAKFDVSNPALNFTLNQVPFTGDFESSPVYGCRRALASGNPGRLDGRCACHPPHLDGRRTDHPRRNQDRLLLRAAGQNLGARS